MMIDKISKYIATLDIDRLSEERKFILQPLIEFIQFRKNLEDDIRLIFVCTHNSRRSHLSQIWAQVMAKHFGIGPVYSYSGGTEATSMYTMVRDTLINTGLEVDTLSDSDNSIYSIRYDVSSHPIIAFSKKYDDAFNPASDFAAIMTCTSADEGCPIILGAAARIPVRYDDPKAFDQTPLAAEKYLERSTQIATEMKYVFSQITT